MTDQWPCLALQSSPLPFILTIIILTIIMIISIFLLLIIIIIIIMTDQLVTRGLAILGPSSSLPSSLSSPPSSSSSLSLSLRYSTNQKSRSLGALRPDF